MTAPVGPRLSGRQRTAVAQFARQVLDRIEAAIDTAPEDAPLAPKARAAGLRRARLAVLAELRRRDVVWPGDARGTR